MATDLEAMAAALNATPEQQSALIRAVPDGARLVTLAELRDRIAKESGSLRLGPRGSYLRMTMRIFPLGLRGTIRRVTGGVAEAGHRVFSLTYSTGTRTPGNWTNLVFLKPGDAERQLWIWTLDDERAERQARIAARGNRRRAAQAPDVRVDTDRAVIAADLAVCPGSGQRVQRAQVTPLERAR